MTLPPLGPTPSHPQPWNPYRAPVRVTWWQQWWVVVPALLLCAPIGLIGLWRRPGVGTGRRVLVTAVVLVALAGVGLTGGESTPPDSAGAQRGVPATALDATPAATPSAAEPESSPSPVPEEVVAEEIVAEPAVAASRVPDLVGLSAERALDRLVRADLVAGEITHEPSDQPVGTVLWQGSKPGESLDAGSAVVVTVAAPYPAVPAVVGDVRRAAVRALTQAGFDVRVLTQTRTSGRDGAVLEQTPSGSSLLAPGSVVTIVVADVVRPLVPATPVQSCTAGYSPCLTPASDYDCAGGSGNGPAYASGPIAVTGSDPYDLDSDGDGVACES